jgi:hypothetical protein
MNLFYSNALRCQSKKSAAFSSSAPGLSGRGRQPQQRISKGVFSFLPIIRFTVQVHDSQNKSFIFMDGINHTEWKPSRLASPDVRTFIHNRLGLRVPNDVLDSGINFDRKIIA